MRLPPLRSLVLFALLLAGLVNVHALVLSVRAHARFQESAFATVRARVSGIRAALGQRVALGGGYDRDVALRQALAEGVWKSVEAFAPDGRPLAALPGPASVNHWVTAAELESLRSGAVLVGAEPFPRSHRILAYALLAGPDEQAVLRFTAESPELAKDRDERQQIFLGHAATLLVLLLVGGNAMAPRTAEGGGAPPRALVAYEEAMERLRDHGQEQTVRHEAERRQIEEVLRGKEALARAGELTAGIVHEVRNGLGTILGYARLLEKGQDEDAQAHGHNIREECETLETVVRRFMEFVKTERLSPGAFDLGRMLERVASRESRSRAGAPVVIRGEAGTLMADEELLERAFENLVRNAREAAGPSGHVEIDASRANGFVSVAVRDDGPGLSPATRERLRPFFTTKAGGLGLGLPIALKIVLLHHGDLTYTDRAPRGLTVTVRLPEGTAVDEGRYDA